MLKAARRGCILPWKFCEILWTIKQLRRSRGCWHADSTQKNRAALNLQVSGLPQGATMRCTVRLCLIGISLAWLHQILSRARRADGSCLFPFAGRLGLCSRLFTNALHKASGYC